MSKKKKGLLTLRDLEAIQVSEPSLPAAKVPREGESDAATGEGAEGSSDRPLSVPNTPIPGSAPTAPAYDEQQLASAAAAAERVRSQERMPLAGWLAILGLALFAIGATVYAIMIATQDSVDTTAYSPQSAALRGHASPTVPVSFVPVEVASGDEAEGEGGEPTGEGRSQRRTRRGGDSEPVPLRTRRRAPRGGNLF